MIIEKVKAEFMLWLEKSKQVSVREALDFISDYQQELSYKDFKDLLVYANIGTLFEVLQIASNEKAELTKAVFEQPDNYQLKFISFNEIESDYSESYQCKVVKGSLVAMGKRSRWVDIQLKKYLHIFGAKEGAENLAERIRAFANLFASTLARKDYQAVNTFVASAAQDKFNQAYFEKRLAKYEKRCGEVQLVDHVFSRAVYNGDFSCVTEMIFSLPKGLEENSRRGSASFHLVSSVTPNGVTLFSQELFIDVIEEEGRFKVVGVSFID